MTTSSPGAPALERTWRTIAGRALSIPERIRQQGQLESAQAGIPSFTRQEWIAGAFGGDGEGLDRWLVEQGIGTGTEWLLGEDVSFVAAASVPDWVPAAQRMAAPFRVDWDDAPGWKVEYEPIFAPVIAEARRALLAHGADPGGLAPAAVRDLEVLLLRRVGQIVAPALHLEAGIRAAASKPGPGGFRTFVDSVAATGLQKIFELYPVAARGCVGLARDWADFIAAFLRHLRADRSLLDRWGSAGTGGAAAELTRIEGPLSDYHDGGRTVLCLHFGSRRLIYKPRPMQFEQLCFALAGSLDGPNAVRTPRLLVREQHGWMEHIESRAPADPIAATALAGSLGRWLAVLHFLRVSDVHQENLICSGADAVVVDAEVGLQPAEADEDWVERASGRDVDLEDGLQRVGMLSSRIVDADGQIREIEAVLSPWLDRPATHEVRRWTDVNSDRMSCRPVRGSYGNPLAHLWLPGAAFSAIDWRDEIARAFTAALERLAGIALPLAGTALRVRRISQDTAMYDQILRATAEPGALTDGAQWDILCAGIAGRTSRRGQISREEAEPLRKRDVPRFDCELGAGALEVLASPERRLASGAGRVALEEELRTWLGNPPVFERRKGIREKAV